MPSARLDKCRGGHTIPTSLDFDEMNTLPYYASSIVQMLFGLALSTAALAMMNTAVPLWLEGHGVSATCNGLVATLFFGGTMIGTLTAGRMILRFGFNRCYQLACAVCLIATAMLCTMEDWWLWGLWRVFAGISSAWIWVVVESALLRIGSKSTRGVLLAWYMIVYYGGTVLGQLLLTCLPEEETTVIAVACGGAFIALIPFFFLRLPEPRRDKEPPPAKRWGPLLYPRCARLGVFGCLTAGVALGCMYSLMPLYLVHQGVQQSNVGMWTAVLIGAGILGQYPVGKLADRLGREHALRILCGLAVMACVVALAEGHHMMLPAVVLLGASVFTLYPVAMAWGCEQTPREDLVSMNQMMLLMFSVGSMVGPLATGFLMQTYSYEWMLISVGSVVFFYLPLMVLYRPRGIFR